MLCSGWVVFLGREKKAEGGGSLSVTRKVYESKTIELSCIIQIQSYHYRYYKFPDATYFMIQASGGGPVAFPIETGVGITALQTVPQGVQHNEPQIVLLPDSGEIDNPPPYAAAASGYQIELVDMPPSYEEAVRDEWRTYV